jgi:hypothetical protein
MWIAPSNSSVNYIGEVMFSMTGNVMGIPFVFVLKSIKLQNAE